MIVSFPSTKIRSFTFPSSCQTNSFLLIWTSFFHYISHHGQGNLFSFLWDSIYFFFPPPTLPYPTLLHLALTYLALLCPTLLCPTLSFPIQHYLTLFYLTLSYPTLPYLTLPYLTLLYPTSPYLILPYVALPYLILPYVALPYSTFPIYIHSICRKTKELPLCPCARSPLYRRAT